MTVKKYVSIRLNLLLIGLIFLSTGNMVSVFSSSVPFRDYLRVILAFVGLIDMMRVIDFRKVKVNNVLTPLLFLSVLIFASTFVFYISRYNPKWTLLQLGEALAWIGVFSSAYYCGLYDHEAVEKLSLFACFIFLYSYLFLHVKAFSANRGIPLISTAYYPLFMLPFAFLLKNKILKWGCVVAAFFSLILSMKRAGFIAFALAIIVYFFLEFRVNEKGSKKRLMVIVSAVCIITGLVIFLLKYIEGTYSVLTRLQNISEDEGSGRIQVWSYSFGMLKDSNAIQWLFGHGFDTVYENSELELSAHTDTIEVVYDYGLIGTFLVIHFVKCLIRVFRKTCQLYKEVVAPFGASCVIVLVVAMVSHVIIFPTYFLSICLFWGLVSGSVEYRETYLERKDYE